MCSSPVSLLELPSWRSGQAFTAEMEPRLRRARWIIRTPCHSWELTLLSFLLLAFLSIHSLSAARIPLKADDEVAAPDKEKIPGCHFDGHFFELEEQWHPDLGPPFGVMYCVRCTCLAVPKKGQMTGKVRCQNFKHECPKTDCAEPVLLPNQCCKVCPQLPSQVLNHLSDGSGELDTSLEGSTFQRSSLFRSSDSQPGTPKSERKRLIIDAKATQNSAAQITPAPSPPLSPVAKRLILLQKQTRSEPSLLSWILKPSTCCCTAPRPSDPQINPRLAVDHLFTLTPLYLDTEHESFEIRRSAPLAVSPLPWDASPGQQPDYPVWIRDELRLSLRARPKPGLSKAKSEDRSRSFTIPNLPSQLSAPAVTCTAAVIHSRELCATEHSMSSSQPSALDRDSSSPALLNGFSSASSLYSGTTTTGRPPIAHRPHSRQRTSHSQSTQSVEVPETVLEVLSPVGSAPLIPPEPLPSVASLQSRRPALTPVQTFAESRQSSIASNGDLSDIRVPSTPGTPLSVQNYERRRSSVVVIPPMQICPGDLLVYGSHPSTPNASSSNMKPPKSPANSFEKQEFAGSTASLPNSDGGSGPDSARKKPWSIMKLFDRSSRSKSDSMNLEDQLLTLKTCEFHDESLMRYKILHWSDLTILDGMELPEAEIKRREAIWEMFQSELVLLLDHLLVLKHVFLEPLKQLQVEGFIMHAAPEKLFGNVDELCSTSYELCINFAELMEQGAKKAEHFVTVDQIAKLLQRNSENYEFEPEDDRTLAFQRYCLNYINALNYLEQVRKHDDFNEYEKYCSQDRRCHRLQLTDLLVTPVQHTMKRPLLLREICKYSEKCGYDCTQLKLLLEETESSLRGLDEKINWLRNFEKLQAIQKQLVWPSVIDLQDPKIFIPDVLKQHLAKQPCEGLILSPRRIIIQEGPLFMIENGKPVEMQVFLFDDMLLLTKKRKSLGKKKSTVSEAYNLVGSWSQSWISESSTKYVVYKQPMPLDRIMVHDMSPSETTNSLLKNSLVILHVSRYQQIISAVTLQAANDATRVLWLSKIRLAMDRWRSQHFDQKITLEQTRAQFSTVSEF